MVLPSVNDAGSNQVVISPFTSLIGEAIKGKNSSDLSEDLSVAEGCTAAGDKVAENISTEVTVNSETVTFNVTWADLISDFIATGGTSNITEDVAAKVAAFFLYYKEIKDEISSELSTRYNKDVTPNALFQKIHWRQFFLMENLQSYLNFSRFIKPAQMLKGFIM